MITKNRPTLLCELWFPFYWHNINQNRLKESNSAFDAFMTVSTPLHGEHVCYSMAFGNI